MTAKKAPVRRTARVYGRASVSAINGPAAVLDEAEVGEKADAARLAILNATLDCFSEFGWSGTNMSVIARRSGMTRGRIQYYFPTLDGLLRAAIEHLMVEWRKKYFSSISEAGETSARFDTGIAVLWNLMQDPLHIARQELQATARTNPELGALLTQTTIYDDEASIEAVKRAYPELAPHGDAALRRARDFTMVFMEGLSLYGFGADAEVRREELIGMLRGFLISYWSAFGVDNLGRAPPIARKGSAGDDRGV
jgi:AcrR family transcriptional regulator